MTLVRRALLLATLLLGTIAPLFAQAMTGTPPLGTFGGGPVDTINLANNNVHISIPVVNKTGRGINFTYTLGYDSSVWYPTGSSGSQSWQPAQNWGWIAQTQSGTGYLGYTYTVQYIACPNGPELESTYSDFIYYEPFGTQHAFPNALVLGGLCGSGYMRGGVASDGSGYSISGFNVYSRAGTLINTPQNPYGNGTGSGTDSNGNYISVSSGGVFTDTLGQTVLTLGGSGTPSSPNTFTYTAPSGANAYYTMKYTTYTVRTNFGCSGIAEFGANGTTTENLVSEIDLPDGTKYLFTYEPTPGYSGDVTGRLASVQLPTGGTISYQYSGGTGSNNSGIVCADGSAATLTRYTPDTGSNYWTYAHTESGTAWATTITDPQGNQTVENFQGIYQTEAQVYQGTSTLLKTTYTCYNGSAVPCNSTAITSPITQETTYTQWPGGLESEVNTLYDKETSSGTTTSYGLVTETDEYGYGSGSPGALVRKTLTTYASLGNNIVNRPASVTVQNGSGNVSAETTYCYDEGTPSGTTTCNAAGSPTPTSGTPQHNSVTGSRGNPTTITYLVSGSTILSKTSTYYDTGNVYVATDVNGAQTTYTYGGCVNSFPSAVSEPLSLSQSLTWNCTGGVQTSVTDENGQTVSTGYTDAYFWRPNSATDQLSYVTNFAYNAQTSVETSMNFNGSTSTTDDLATVDGLGRSHISQIKESQSSTTYDSTETDYDSLGRPDRTTLPYAAPAGQTSASAPALSTTYDPLSRPTQVLDSGGGSTTYSYNQNDTYLTAGPHPTGENSKQKQLEYDALGRLTSVCEITSASGSGTCSQSSSQTGYWTTYTYNLNNNLTGVTQNAQSSSTQTRSYAYDDLGRMTSETNPESGTTSYTYDTDSTCGTSKGDLVKKIDAVGDTICYGYDALHRVTSMTYPSGSYSSVTPGKYFVYDAATVNSVTMSNAKTRLAEAYTCFSPCSTKLTDEGFSYTARGQQSDIYESTPNSGGYYHVNETYWANGSVDQLSGLSGLPTITYGVDGEGRTYSASASSGQSPLSSTTYNVASLPTAVNLGSSDSDSFSYDPNTNRMTQYSFNVNGQSVVGGLTWNALGTLAALAVTDPFNSADAQSCSYSSDDLVRIASANCGSIWSQTFSYDAFGNISKSGSLSFQPTYSYLTNRMTEIGSSTPTYDSNGNVTNDFLNTYSWDANGRPITIDGVGATYDALGNMVQQNRSGAYTQIVYTPSGAKLALMNGSTLQKGFVPLAGGSMAVYNSSGLSYYRHSDWIGSSRFASTPSRTMYYDGAYGPFGEQYANTGSNDLSFTGMNQDTASNVYDFPAREYGIQGRWPSPDPAGMSSSNPADPQSWNRYAYVRNSPLFLTDPTGMDDCDMNSADPEATWGCLTNPIPFALYTINNNTSQCGEPDLPGCQIGGTSGNTSYCDPSTGPWSCGMDGPVGASGCAGTTSQGIPNCIAAPQGPQKPRCTAAQQSAAALAKAFDKASSATGWIAFGSGVGTALAGAGEGISFGGDTPVTITFGSMTTFFGVASFATGAMGSALNSFASGNMDAARDFNSSQVTNLIAQAATSRIPLVARWAETIGDLAEQAADLGATAKEACHE